jgi:hypothetical protein
MNTRHGCIGSGRILFAVLTLLIVPLLCSPAHGASKMWWATCTTGGGDCLDGIDGASLTDGDGAMVDRDNSGTPEASIYRLTNFASSPPVESLPDVITPDSNAGNKRWILTRVVAKGIGLTKESGTAGQSCTYTGYTTDLFGVCAEGPSDHRTANLLLKYPDGSPNSSILVYGAPDGNGRSAGAWQSLSGTVVGTTGTQTLSGKTLTAPKETVVAGGTCSTSYTPDLSAGSMFTLTLNGDCTITNPSNLTAGQSFIIKLTQSGATAPTWGTNYKWPAGTTPTWSTSATKYDAVACVSFDGTSLQCNGLVDVR